MFTVEKLIEEIDTEREKEILTGRLSGLSLEEIGQKLNITKERVRIIQSCIIPDSRLEEQKYLSLFEQYMMDQKVFSVITEGLSEKSYRYLYIITRKDLPKKNLFELWFDPNFTPGFKKKVFRLLKESRNHRIIVNSVLRESIFKIILKEDFSEQRSIDFFIERYQEFLEIYGCSEVKTMAKKALINKLELSPCVLLSKGRIIRYFDIYNVDFTELLTSIGLHDVKNLEYSTLKFFRCNPLVMRKFDIRNEYELHNLLRKLSFLEKYKTYFEELSISFGRMPIIRIGQEVNRIHQVSELIRGKNLSIAEVAALYEEHYGIRSASLFTDKEIRTHIFKTNSQETN